MLTCVLEASRPAAAAPPSIAPQACRATSLPEAMPAGALRSASGMAGIGCLTATLSGRATLYRKGLG